MAAASLDVNFKEELSAIEQCEYAFHHVGFSCLRKAACTVSCVRLVQSPQTVDALCGCGHFSHQEGRAASQRFPLRSRA